MLGEIGGFGTCGVVSIGWIQGSDQGSEKLDIDYYMGLIT